MTNRILAVASMLVLGSLSFAQAPGEETAIALAVRKLGSASFVQRELAHKELEAIGPQALDALRRAAKSADAETKHRLDDLIRRFEQQLLTRQILAPKEVELKLDGASPQQALAELTKVSGYSIQFLGDATKLANKKITLDTGKTSFWQAFDRLCDEAGLMERAELVSSSNGSTFPGGLRRPIGTAKGMPSGGTIIVTPRSDERSTVHYAGAIKVEARVSKIAASKELNLTVIVSAEPRLVNVGLIASPQFEKILDDNLRAFAIQPDQPKAAPNQLRENDMGMDFIDLGAMPTAVRHVQLRIKPDSGTPTLLKTMLGKLTVQLDLQNEVVAKMDNILAAAGKTADGANGGSMKVGAVRKLPNGNIEIQVALENLSTNPFGPNVIINGGNVIIRGNGVIVGGGRILGGGNSADLPDLLDTKGAKFKLASLGSHSTNITNGSISRNATIIYQPNPGQTEPRDLILFGSRTHTIAVPFRFEDLPVR